MTEKQTHTPGPWVWQSEEECLVGPEQIVMRQDAEGRKEFAVYSDGTHFANARLIAQAPAMLRALQKAENNMILMYSGIAGGDAEAGQRFADKDPVVAVVRSVIAAATGEAP